MRIKITGKGIFGASGELPIGTEIHVKSAPAGWKGRYIELDGDHTNEELKAASDATVTPQKTAGDDVKSEKGGEPTPAVNPPENTPAPAAKPVIPTAAKPVIPTAAKPLVPATPAPAKPKPSAT